MKEIWVNVCMLENLIINMYIFILRINRDGLGILLLEFYQAIKT